MASIIANIGNWGWFAKTTGAIYAVPLMTWGLGAAEGTIRTAFQGLALAYSKATGNIPAARQHWMQTKRDGGITISCITLAGVSAIPVVGTSCGYWYIVKECLDLHEIRNALKRALEAKSNANDQEIIKELDRLDTVDEATLKRLFESMVTPLKNNQPVRFLEEDRNLKGSLFHYYYGFSIPYLTIEYTCHGIQSTINVTHRIAVNLFKNGIIKKLVKSAIIAVYSEVQQTSVDVAVDEHLHPIFRNPN